MIKMYVLYDYDVYDKEILRSMDQYEIIEVMGKLMSKSIGQRFLIVHYDEITHAPETTSIKNVRDFYNYATDYNNKLKQESCVELKRKILERNKK